MKRARSVTFSEGNLRNTFGYSNCAYSFSPKFIPLLEKNLMDKFMDYNYGIYNSKLSWKPGKVGYCVKTPPCLIIINSTAKKKGWIAFNNNRPNLIVPNLFRPAAGVHVSPQKTKTEMA